MTRALFEVLPKSSQAAAALFDFADEARESYDESIIKEMQCNTVRSRRRESQCSYLDAAVGRAAGRL